MLYLAWETIKTSERIFQKCAVHSVGYQEGRLKVLHLEKLFFSQKKDLRSFSGASILIFSAYFGC